MVEELDAHALADELEPRDEIEAGKPEDVSFRLSVALDVLREKALMLRVVVVVEVIVALVLMREVILLFVVEP